MQIALKVSEEFLIQNLSTEHFFGQSKADYDKGKIKVAINSVTRFFKYSKPFYFWKTQNIDRDG